MPKKLKLNVTFTPDQLELREHYAQSRRAYYRDCLRIRDRTGEGIIPFVPNPGQEALERLRDRIEAFHQEVASFITEQTGQAARREPVRMMILKARRVGFSTDIAAQMFHYCEHNKGKNGLVVAHLQPNANNIVQISRRFFQQFPKELADLKIPMAKESDELEWGDVDDQPWDSRIIIATAGSKNFARGFEFNSVHLSECAHYKNPDAIAAAKDAAQYADYIYEESTANGMDPYFYVGWQSALTLSEVRDYWNEHNAFPEDWNGKYRFFWAWWQDAAYHVPLTHNQKERVLNSLTPSEKDGVTKFNWSAEQIEWRRRKIAGDCTEQTQMDPEDYFRQEYPSEPDEAFVTSGKTVFPALYLSGLQTKAKKNKPKFHGMVKGYSGSDLILQKSRNDMPFSSPLVLWTKPKPEHQYVVGARAAEGLKHTDFSVAIVLDRTNGTILREVACYRGQATAIELAQICAWLGQKYNNAWVIPEASMPTLSKHLIKVKYSYVYQRKNEERVGESGIKDVFTPGFKAWRANRHMVLNHSQDAFRKEEIDIKSMWLVKEHLAFMNVDGAMQAPSGTTDDGVICTGLAVWAHREWAPKVVTPSDLVEGNPFKEPEDAMTAYERDILEAVKKKKAKSMRMNRRLKARNRHRFGVPRNHRGA
jgi:hypothetical protein